MQTLKPIPSIHPQYGMYYIEEDLRDAAYRGDLTRAMALFAQYPKLDSNATNEYSETALYIACKRKQDRIAEYLLKHPEIRVDIPTILGNSALLICAWTDNTQLAKRLVQAGAGVHARTHSDRKYHGNVSAFDIAQERNNHELVEFLLAHISNSANPSFTYRTR